MESKLINKINQNYNEILNILKTFLREIFNKVKENNKNFNSFEENILNKKDNEIDKYIQEYSNDNNKIFEKMNNLKNNINELINEILNNKMKIIENINESLFLVKHPQDCLFLLQVDKYNNDIYNYLNLINAQIEGHNFDKLETIYFILSNIKISSK